LGFGGVFEMNWMFDQESINWEELSNLYKIAPHGDKKPEDLKIAFSNSRYKCFVFDHEKLIGVGRALADGVDCSYLCDVAVHPDYQGIGLGKEIINKLKEFSAGHKKIILYANPGKEGFYKKLGFRRMRTAMANLRWSHFSGHECCLAIVSFPGLWPKFSLASVL
jgi:ribosomal protein S18 acetylase RimI-like enzyme